jgi:hypothetical protein
MTVENFEIDIKNYKRYREIRNIYIDRCLSEMKQCLQKTK